MNKRFPTWILDARMLWGAILGAAIWTGYAGLLDTWRHRGSGIVQYGEDGENPVKENERDYKRYYYVMDGLMFLTGVGLWVVVATHYKEDSAVTPIKS